MAPSVKEFENVSLVTNFAKIQVSIVKVWGFRGHKNKENTFLN